MKTRHPELSRDTKFQDIQALKDLQIVAQKQGQKEEKVDENQKREGEQIRSGDVVVPHHTIHPLREAAKGSLGF